MSEAQATKHERNRAWVEAQISADKLSVEAAPAVLALLNTLRDDEPAASAEPEAAQALADLWFRLDEIQAVAESIQLVQEHVSEAGGRAGRIDSLARAVSGLARAALGLHGVIEGALRVG